MNRHSFSPSKALLRCFSYFPKRKGLLLALCLISLTSTLPLVACKKQKPDIDEDTIPFTGSVTTGTQPEGAATSLANKEPSAGEEAPDTAVSIPALFQYAPEETPAASTSPEGLGLPADAGVFADLYQNLAPLQLPAQDEKGQALEVVGLAGADLVLMGQAAEEPLTYKALYLYRISQGSLQLLTEATDGGTIDPLFASSSYFAYRHNGPSFSTAQVVNLADGQIVESPAEIPPEALWDGAALLGNTVLYFAPDLDDPTLTQINAWDIEKNAIQPIGTLTDKQLDVEPMVLMSYLASRPDLTATQEAMDAIQQGTGTVSRFLEGIMGTEHLSNKNKTDDTHGAYEQAVRQALATAFQNNQPYRYLLFRNSEGVENYDLTTPDVAAFVARTPEIYHQIRVNDSLSLFANAKNSSAFFLAQGKAYAWDLSSYTVHQIFLSQDGALLLETQDGAAFLALHK